MGLTGFELQTFLLWVLYLCLKTNKASLRFEMKMSVTNCSGGKFKLKIMNLQSGASSWENSKWRLFNLGVKVSSFDDFVILGILNGNMLNRKVVYLGTHHILTEWHFWPPSFVRGWRTEGTYLWNDKKIRLLTPWSVGNEMAFLFTLKRRVHP